jgi:V8-like Glu-specific endopeptidase
MNTLLEEILMDEIPEFGEFSNKSCNCAKCRAGVNDEFELIGSDDRAEVSDTTEIPYRYVCNIEYDGKAWATGTLINRYTVLTAGHNIVEKSSGKVRDKNKFRIIPGRKGNYFPWGVGTIDKFEIAENYIEGSNTDYAIIRLKEPLGVKLGFWGFTSFTNVFNGSTIRKNTPIGVAGYPADKPSGSSYYCRDVSKGNPRSCYHTFGIPGRSRLCGTYQWGSYDGLVNGVSGGIIDYSSDTCSGHSGSPVFLYYPQGDRYELVGVHISGTGSGSKGNRAVLIDRKVRDFIKKYSK